MTRDVPDDIVDAEPTGGWTGADPVDSGAESGADALAAVQEESPDEETATDAAAPAPDGAPSQEGARASDPYVESAEIQQGLDPDIVTDEQAGR
jgi:hypothetical protein